MIQVSHMNRFRNPTWVLSFLIIKLQKLGGSQEDVAIPPKQIQWNHAL
jgi:hypothetical protein